MDITTGCGWKSLDKGLVGSSEYHSIGSIPFVVHPECSTHPSVVHFATSSCLLGRTVRDSGLDKLVFGKSFGFAIGWSYRDEYDGGMS